MPELASQPPSPPASGVTSPFWNPHFLLVLAITTMASVSVFSFYLYPHFLQVNGIPEGLIGLAMGAFYSGSFFGMVLMPPVFRWIGGRPALLAGCVVLGVTGALLFFPLPMWLVIVIRTLQGVAWAAVLISTAVASLNLAGNAMLARAGSVYGACFLVGQAIGPAVGEFLIDLTGRFVAVAALACVAAAASLLSATFLNGSAFCAEGARMDKFRPMGIVRPLAAIFLLSAGFGGATSFVVNHASASHITSASSFFLGILLSGLFFRFYVRPRFERSARLT